MTAALAIVSRWVWDAAVMSAKWLATKALVVAILTIFLPWVLKGVFVWGFDYLMVYGRSMLNTINDLISGSVGEALGSYTFSHELTGIGGYLASQTGLVDYFSIIITGWGIYWYVCVLSKSSRFLR